MKSHDLFNILVSLIKFSEIVCGTYELLLFFSDFPVARSLPDSTQDIRHLSSSQGCGSAVAGAYDIWWVW